MAEGRLVIGTKRYSSWSLRGWLAVHLAGLDVEEVVIPLAGGGGTDAIKSATPAGL
ncbi:MAG: glutathione S-transferase, partial [Acetobacteraceae bacterium]|nr:glutathione S-transferase [Acetobacteraceae bacterium]